MRTGYGDAGDWTRGVGCEKMGYSADDSALPVNVQDALEATKIAAALTHSFRSGQPVYFDDQGEAILA